MIVYRIRPHQWDPRERHRFFPESPSCSKKHPRHWHATTYAVLFRQSHPKQGFESKRLKFLYARFLRRGALLARVRALRWAGRRMPWQEKPWLEAYRGFRTYA